MSRPPVQTHASLSQASLRRTRSLKFLPSSSSPSNATCSLARQPLHPHLVQRVQLPGARVCAAARS
eukprot:4482835-Pleurochrysis_carterae.AAC.1